MDEKKIFDEYGNYNFPTEKKQEGLNTIEGMKMDIIKTFSLEYIYAQSEVMKRESDIDVLVNSLIAKGYRKESDTAKEILTEIKNLCIGKGTLYLHDWAELWEKYVGKIE